MKHGSQNNLNRVLRPKVNPRWRKSSECHALLPDLGQKSNLTMVSVSCITATYSFCLKDYCMCEAKCHDIWLRPRLPIHLKCFTRGLSTELQTPSLPAVAIFSIAIKIGPNCQTDSTLACLHFWQCSRENVDGKETDNLWCLFTCASTQKKIWDIKNAIVGNINNPLFLMILSCIQWHSKGLTGEMACTGCHLEKRCSFINHVFAFLTESTHKV